MSKQPVGMVCHPNIDVTIYGLTVNPHRKGEPCAACAATPTIDGQPHTVDYCTECHEGHVLVGGRCRRCRDALKFAQQVARGMLRVIDVQRS